VNDPMRILKADHREVEQLLGRLADTDEGRERDALVAEVVTKLTAHMDAEESIVYPSVAEQVGAEDAEEADIEHGLVRTALEQLQAMTAVPGFGAVVEMLKAGIAHHVQEEEQELLPELKDTISRDEWEAMGDALVEAKRRAGLPVPSMPTRRSTKRSSASGRSTRGATKKATAAKKPTTAAKKPAKKTATAATTTAKKTTAKKTASAGRSSRSRG
jgi:hemerythrin superfamily protein